MRWGGALALTGILMACSGGPPARTSPRTAPPSSPATQPSSQAAQPAPLPDGRILTINHRWKVHFRVAILGVVEHGKLREARREDTCGLKEGTVLQLQNVLDDRQLSATVGGTDFHREGHCHSSSDDKKLPGMNLLATTGLSPAQAVRREAVVAGGAMDARALSDLRRLSKGELRPDAYTHRLTLNRYRVGPRRYTVVNAVFSPRRRCPRKGGCWWHDFCGPGTHVHSAVLVYEGSGAAPALRFHRLELPRRPDDVNGQVSFVGFLPVRKEGAPWLVLYVNSCEAWEFELYLPAGKTWRRRLIGSTGSTV